MNLDNSHTNLGMTKVSVIVPIHNAMAYLPEAINSVLDQTFRDFEIIMIDDGSSDGVKDWVARVHDLRVQLISQTHSGTSAARNNGIANSQGEYLAFLDADDVWEQTKLEKQVALLDNAHEEVGLVYTPVALIDQKSALTGHVFANCPEGDVWEHLVIRNFLGCGSSPMIRRSCFDTVGVFDSKRLGSYLEDWDMWLRIARQYKFSVVNEPLVFYRLHPYGSSKNWQAMEDSYHILIHKAILDAPISYNSTELRELQCRSEGSIYFVLAWQALHAHSRNFEAASAYRAKALNIYPNLRYSKENLRLIISIFLIKYIGPTAYSLFLSKLYIIRKYLWKRLD